MKKTKIERNHHRNVSPRKAPRKTRARRKTTPVRRMTHATGREVLGVLLAGTGWDPSTIASAFAAIGSPSAAMSLTGSQLVFLWLDEQPQKQHAAPKQSTVQSPHVAFERVMSREDVIATD